MTRIVFLSRTFPVRPRRRTESGEKVTFTKRTYQGVKGWWVICLAVLSLTLTATAQTPPSRFDILRGEYGQYRANNDLLFYHLDIRVDPEKKYLSGKVVTRFKMLQDD